MEPDPLTPLNYTYFAIDLKRILECHPEDLYQIDESDDNKDILSKILFLSKDMNKSKQICFMNKKYEVIIRIINRAGEIFKKNPRPFLAKSTLLADLAYNYFKSSQSAPTRAHAELKRYICEITELLITKGLDLNYVHNRRRSNGDTSLMLLFKYLTLESRYHDQYDFPYNIIPLINVRLDQINVEIKNKRADTILTYLTKNSTNDAVFGLFKILLTRCNNPSIIYKSKIHHKAVMALSAINLEHVRTNPQTNNVRVVELLYRTYSCPSSDDSGLLQELSQKRIVDSERVCRYFLNYGYYYEEEYQVIFSTTIIKPIKNILNKNKIRCEEEKLNCYRSKYLLFKKSAYFK